MSQWDRLGSLLRLLERPASGEFLSDETAEAIAAVVPCDSIAVFEFHRPTSTTTRYVEWLGRPGIFEGPPDPDAEAAFWQLFWASPFCTFDQRPGMRNEVVVQQDFHPGRRWRATPMYLDCLGRAPVEAEALLPLAAPTDVSRRLLLVRQIARDFDEDDRLVLRLLRPHLDAAQGRAARGQLTPRQREVLGLAARGATYDRIGHRLDIAPATVRKHLENAYARLGARGRAEAVTRAFPEGIG